MDGPWLAERLVVFIPLLLSLTVHEWAHAYAAWRLGDDTARALGRMTLDPLAHIDPVGTLVLPLLGIPFGWAKPVPVEPVRFRRGLDMRVGLTIVAAAGPAANLVLAIGCGGLLAVLARVGADGPTARALLESAALLNVALAVFNLLPVPPLDGSRVVEGLLPDALRPLWNVVQGLGVLPLVAVLAVPILLGVDVLGAPLAWALSVLRAVAG